MEEKKKRNFKKQIIDFVQAWYQVVEAKKEEFWEPDAEEKEALKNANQQKANDDPSSPFGYIYNWLNLDAKGNFLPHDAKRKIEGKKNYRKRKKIYPIGADIADYFCDYPPESYNDESSIITSVGRALKEMAGKKLIFESDKTYRPMTLEYLRTSMIPTLAKHSSIEERCFFSVSSSTYVVYYTTEHLNGEITFFRKFIGEESLFDIFSFGTKIIIFLRGNVTECRELGKIIRKAVRQAYQMQIEEREKAEKATAKISLTKR